MNGVTVVVWLVITLSDFILIGIWLRNRRAGATAPRPIPTPPFLHALAAFLFLVLFLIYIFAGFDSLGFATLVGLMIVAALGIALFVRWLSGARPRSISAGAVGAPTDSVPAPVVALHSIAAAATLVLYLLAVYIVAS